MAQSKQIIDAKNAHLTSVPCRECHTELLTFGHTLLFAAARRRRKIQQDNFRIVYNIL